MENNESKDENFAENDQEEKIPDSFVCSICLDLLYKPVVLSCGHICCFWCVRKSMDGLYAESECPVCRNPYHHFPKFCQMIHLLLLKTCPVAYKRRERQTLVDEEEKGIYSPPYRGPSHSSTSKAIVNPAAKSCSTESSDYMKQSGSATHKGDDGTSYSEHTSERMPVVVGTASIKGKELCQNEHHQQPKVLVEDFKCTMCKQLLFHPVVINCGHVYCESCIFSLADEMLRCQDCQIPHPSGFPKVCLALDHFLEERFPEEYALQKELNQIKVKPETTSSSSLNNDKRVKIKWSYGPGSKVHFSVGCDHCGMFPINGDRYMCIDCQEWISYDLCGDCYKTRPNLPGRFNQQHSSEHRFMAMSCYGMDLLRFIQQGCVGIIPGGFLPADDGEDDQNDSGGFLPADDGEDDDLNDYGGFLPVDDGEDDGEDVGEDDQNDSESTN